MARLPVVGSDSNQWGALLNAYLRVAHREDGAPRGAPMLLDARDFGVTGDGVTDDTLALNACLSSAGASAKHVFIAANMTVRVTGNLFVFGRSGLIGEDKHTSRIVLDADLEGRGAGLSAYWVNFGIKEKGGSACVWTGTVRGVQFEITASGFGTAPYLQAIQFHAAADFAFEDCIVDLMALEHRPCAAMVSQLDGAWCATPGTEHGRIQNNILLGKNKGNPATGGSGGINLVALHGGLIAGNRIEGFADDGIALADCSQCIVRDNRVRGVRSRIAAFGGDDISFIANRLEREPGTDGVWVASTDFYATFLAGPYSAAPAGVKFIGNTAVLPAGAADGGGYHNFLDIGGARNCLASGNLFINESNAAARTRVLVWAFNVFPEWVDPSGLDQKGTARPRCVILAHNIFSGAAGGRFEEVGNPADLLGPILYEGNIGRGFTVIGPHSFLADSNLSA